MQWRIQDFPEEGAPTLRGGRQDTILLKFPENCMKLKKIRPPGGGARPLRPPLDPPLRWLTVTIRVCGYNFTRVCVCVCVSRSRSLIIKDK